MQSDVGIIWRILRRTPVRVLGENAQGTNIHDRHNLFKTIAKKLKFTKNQDCWSHILQDGKELKKFYGEDGKYIYEILKKTYADAKQYEGKGTETEIEKIYTEMRIKLREPIYTSTKCRRFIENLLKEKDNLFEFVRNPEVEPTNNRAERALRHPVIARKISGGSRSEKGADTYAKLLSLVKTIECIGRDFIIEAQEIITRLTHRQSVVGTSNG